MKHQDSLKRHIYHLTESHRLLEKELTNLEQSHQNDTTRAALLKKKKLSIKDEIARCNQDLEAMQAS
jgi:hypothetical protein